MDKIDLISKLKRYFGFSSFKGQQEDVINNLLEGNDTFVLMPTGGGKSLCYQLPALIMDGTAIVLSPLIALMKNQVDAIRGFVAGNDGIAHFLNSSLSKAQIAEVKKDLMSGATKLLYVAPESLTKAENVAMLKEIKISFYAVDEAHCISEWGHDFRPEYRRIRNIIEEIGVSPIIALTATATPKVQSDIIRDLAERESCIFIGRCADYILRDTPHCINLFFTANLEDRVARMASEKGITAEEAAELIEKTDRRRASYYNFYTGNKWGKYDNYHIAINSAVLGIEGTARLIADMAKLRAQDEE